MRARTILTLALAAALAGEAVGLAAGVAPKVNVNTATVQQLQLLPRVGPALAQRMVDFRTANGAFKTPEEVMRVKGVGEKSFALLKPYLTVEGDTTLKEKVRSPRAAKRAAPAPDPQH
ncbi:MAG: ComEA family DNA-binding protein [Acidobacteriota bacterium]